MSVFLAFFRIPYYVWGWLATYIGFSPISQSHLPTRLKHPGVHSFTFEDSAAFHWTFKTWITYSFSSQHHVRASTSICRYKKQSPFGQTATQSFFRLAMMLLAYASDASRREGGSTQCTSKDLPQADRKKTISRDGEKVWMGNMGTKAIVTDGGLRNKKCRIWWSFLYPIKSFQPTFM